MMELEALSGIIYIWVSRYLAVACLISIAIWGISVYLRGIDWQTRVRDATVYLSSIGVLVLVLALRPVQSDAVLWPPITWFCFTLLIVLELLWLSLLMEMSVAGMKRLAKGSLPHEPTASYPSHGA